MALSADGTIALTPTIDAKVLVWDVKTGALLNTLLTTDFVNSVALSKDGKRALVGTNDGKIQVWNTKPLSGQKETSKPLAVLKGHTGLVKTVAFGGDDFIASGSFDKTVLSGNLMLLNLEVLKSMKRFLGRLIRKLFLDQNFSSKRKISKLE